MVREYLATPDSKMTARVWISPDLDFFIISVIGMLADILKSCENMQVLQYFVIFC